MKVLIKQCAVLLLTIPISSFSIAEPSTAQRLTEAKTLAAKKTAAKKTSSYSTAESPIAQQPSGDSFARPSIFDFKFTCDPAKRHKISIQIDVNLTTETPYLPVEIASGDGNTYCSLKADKEVWKIAPTFTADGLFPTEIPIAWLVQAEGDMQWSTPKIYTIKKLQAQTLVMLLIRYKK